MMPPPSILVLLATHNGETHLSEQLSSLAGQEGVNLSILVSDDSSSDNTLELVRELADRFNVRVSFLPNEGKLGGAAKNFFHLFALADTSAADYIALCDQDDIWLSKKISRAVSLLNENEADFYSCNSIAFWSDGREVRVKKDYPEKRWDYIFESASHGCTYVLTAQVARQFQSFVRARGNEIEDIEFHDWLIYAWARHHKMNWIHDGEHLIRYRQTLRNAIGANIGWRAMQRRIQQMRQGWYRRQSLLIANAIGMMDDPIVCKLARFAWRDRFYLAFVAHQCRRRLRDQFAFMIAVLLVGL